MYKWSIAIHIHFIHSCCFHNAFSYWNHIRLSEKTEMRHNDIHDFYDACKSNKNYFQLILSAMRWLFELCSIIPPSRLLSFLFLFLLCILYISLLQNIQNVVCTWPKNGIRLVQATHVHCSISIMTFRCKASCHQYDNMSLVGKTFLVNFILHF